VAQPVAQPLAWVLLALLPVALYTLRGGGWLGVAAFGLGLLLD